MLLCTKPNYPLDWKPKFQTKALLCTKPCLPLVGNLNCEQSKTKCLLGHFILYKGQQRTKTVKYTDTSQYNVNVNVVFWVNTVVPWENTVVFWTITVSFGKNMVLFGTNTVIFRTNTVVFGKNICIWGKYSPIWTKYSRIWGKYCDQWSAVSSHL